jgi:hypothetical protein
MVTEETPVGTSNVVSAAYWHRTWVLVAGSPT